MSFLENPSLIVPAETNHKPGRITLVGAGPGAADMLTLRAIRCLGQADVVFYGRCCRTLTVENSQCESMRLDKHREVEHILDALGEWQGTDPVTGFQLVKVPVVLPTSWCCKTADKN